MLFHGGSSGKESTCNAGDPALIPGSGRSPGEGNCNPLQYSCLENPLDRGAWRATVLGIPESRTGLKRLSTYTWYLQDNSFPADTKVHGSSSLLCKMGDNGTNFGGLWRQFLDKIYLQHLLFSGGGGLVTKSCPTLYDPMDSSLPGFSVHGILQARILEWVAISFSSGSPQPRN